MTFAGQLAVTTGKNLVDSHMQVPKIAPNMTELAKETLPLLESELQNSATESPIERLQNAVIAQNTAEVARVLDQDQNTSDNLRYQLSHQFETESGTRKILSLACERSSTEIMQLLYEKVVEHQLELMDESWYYWGPLHFAAYGTDSRKLDAIIRFAHDRNLLNSLSIFSENALHVLLEYGRRIEGFPVQLTNGWESRICHIIPEEHDDVVECARLLVDAGTKVMCIFAKKILPAFSLPCTATLLRLGLDGISSFSQTHTSSGIDVNHNNIWNETPLIMAIRYRLLRVIQLLLMKKDVDLDSCKDTRSGKSARDLLRENEIHLHLLSPHTVAVSSVKTLFTFLKSNDEELFLR